MFTTRKDRLIDKLHHQINVLERSAQRLEKENSTLRTEADQATEASWTSADLQRLAESRHEGQVRGARNRLVSIHRTINAPGHGPRSAQRMLKELIDELGGWPSPTKK